MNSTSAGAPFSGITQTSYTLRDLEMETDYVVSVTATNECGIESPPSEEITVRIDLQGNNYTCACSQAITSRCGHGMRECACICKQLIPTNNTTCDFVLVCYVDLRSNLL